MTADTGHGWMMKAGSGLSAHFKRPDGPSRPGVDWSIMLKHGDEIHTVTVRTYFADDLIKSLREDSRYQVQTAMQYLDSLLRQGWDPKQPRDLAITLTNPPAAAPPPESRAGNSGRGP